MTSKIDARSLFLFGVVALGLVAAWVAGNQVAEQDFVGIALILGTFLLGLVWFMTGENLWVYVAGSAFLSGTVGILGNLSPFMILSLLGLAKYIVDKVIFGKLNLRTGVKGDFLLICGFMSVLTWHAISDRLGLRILGSTVWGGRFYVWIYCGLFAYIVLSSLPVDGKAWSKLPLLILFALFFDLIVGVITAMVPSLVEVIAPFYSGVSLSGYQNVDVGVVEDKTGRVGAFGDFGLGILLLVLARYNIASLWRPNYFIAFVGTIVGIAGVLAGGFRSAILNTLLLFLAASIRDLKGRAFLMIAGVAGLLILLPLVHQHVFSLPKQIQRGLTFLPADWDPEMVADAESSNEFRFKIWNIWASKFFPEHPFLGRGFGFDPSLTGYSSYVSDASDINWDIVCVATGSIHNGFFSVIDAMGIVGAVFFIFWQLVLLRRIVIYLLKEDNSGSNPALRYLALYLFITILSYWMGALNVGAYLVRFFVLASAFNALLLQHRSIRFFHEHSQDRDAVDFFGSNPSGKPEARLA
jgi:hypothetical protein